MLCDRIVAHSDLKLKFLRCDLPDTFDISLTSIMKESAGQAHRNESAHESDIMIGGDVKIHNTSLDTGKATEANFASNKIMYKAPETKSKSPGDITPTIAVDVSEIATDTITITTETTISASGGKNHGTRLDRRDWATIYAISDLKFRRLLCLKVDDPKLKDLTFGDYHVIQRLDGGFNHIVKMVAMKNNHTEHYIVRVPAIGTKARWQEGDMHNMRCEVALMKYLHQSSNIPVPEIIAGEQGFSSMIDAPYILMKRLTGRPAHLLWFDTPGDRNHIAASRVSSQTETVRRNILTRLATAIAELRHLRFDKIGMPHFTNTLQFGTNPIITRSYGWKDPSDMTLADLESTGQIYECTPFETSVEYMTSSLEEKWLSIPDPDDDDNPYVQNIFLGIRKILDIVYSLSPITVSKEDMCDSNEKETFVLRHPDLDLQNILTDEMGNVTGILDWEGCLSVPRYVGYSSFPEFLRRDWISSFSLDRSPHMSWLLPHYRQIYNDAMLATGCGDAKYTHKSAMYRAIVDAINEHDNATCSAPDLITKLLACISGLRMSNVSAWAGQTLRHI